MVSALICSHGCTALPPIVCLPRRHMICLFDPVMNSDNNESEHNVIMCWWRWHVAIMDSCSSGGRSLIMGGSGGPRLISSTFQSVLEQHAALFPRKKKNNNVRIGRKCFCTQAADKGPREEQYMWHLETESCCGQTGSWGHDVNRDSERHFV